MSDEVENIWQGNQFGSQSSSALLHMVWFNNTIHFGLQARDEHRRFKFGDVEIKKNILEKKENMPLRHLKGRQKLTAAQMNPFMTGHFVHACIWQAKRVKSIKRWQLAYEKCLSPTEKRSSLRENCNLLYEKYC